MNNQQRAVAIEFHQAHSRLYGLAYFSNSFSQPCIYVYTGNIYSLGESADYKFKGKITCGIIHGYHQGGGKYQGILNKAGTFPALIPAVGIEYRGVEVDIFPFAAAGFMITLGVCL